MNQSDHAAKNAKKIRACFLANVLGAMFISFFTQTASSASLIIDTTGGNGGFNGVAPFGDGSAGEAYGQTFIAPASHPVLTNFSFWLDYIPGASNQPLYFSAVVMAWSTDRASGPILFESPIQTLATDQTEFTEFSFTTGGVELTPGQKYVAFLNASTSFWDNNTTEALVGYMGPNDFYADGEAWFLDTAGFFQVTTAFPWTTLGPEDLAFKATFSPIPIPAAVWLFGSAIGVLGWMRRRQN